MCTDPLNPFPEKKISFYIFLYPRGGEEVKQFHPEYHRMQDPLKSVLQVTKLNSERQSLQRQLTEAVRQCGCVGAWH